MRRTLHEYSLTFLPHLAARGRCELSRRDDKPRRAPSHFFATDSQGTPLIHQFQYIDPTGKPKWYNDRGSNMVEVAIIRQRFSTIGPYLRLLLGVMLVASIVTFNVTEQKRDTGFAISVQEPLLSVQLWSPLVATIENDEGIVSVTGDTELHQSSSTEEKGAKHRVLRRERLSRPAFGPSATTAPPTQSPTSPVPSQMPSTTQAPSQIPSNTPSTRPSTSLAPSQIPSSTPSAQPSTSLAPSQRPTSLPSALPTTSLAPSPASSSSSKKANRPKAANAPKAGMGIGMRRPKRNKRTFIGREINPDDARVSRSVGRFGRFPPSQPPA